MNKQVSTISYIRGFFRDRLSISVCCLCLSILGASYFIFFQKKPLHFFPDNSNLQIHFYNDSIDNGKSIITAVQQSDSLISLSFVLKQGFIWPYVGMVFENKFLNDYNISFFNRMKIDVSGEGIKPIFVYLILKDSSMSFEGNVIGTRYLSQTIEINNRRQIIKLALDDFGTPDWWFDKYNLSPATIKAPNLQQMVRIVFATGHSPIENKEQTIKIYSVDFYRDNTMVILFIGFTQLIIITLMWLIYYFRTRSKNLLKQVTINYHAVTLEQNEKSKNSFLDFINENFSDADLSLQSVSDKTGFSQRIIAKSIAEQFNCNVKTYINLIRIKEAQRLLKETHLNISEIAYKVGFSSPNNFNRVFKNLTAETPSEFQQH